MSSSIFRLSLFIGLGALGVSAECLIFACSEVQSAFILFGQFDDCELPRAARA